MVNLLLDQTQLEVALSPFERRASFQRENLLIPRESILRVQLTQDPWAWLRGIPQPGFKVPNVLAAGEWKSAGARDFVLIRKRHPGVVIDLKSGTGFDRLVFTTRHGLELSKALRLETSAEAEDVSVIVPTGPIPTAGRKSKPKPRLA